MNYKTPDDFVCEFQSASDLFDLEHSVRAYNIDVRDYWARIADNGGDSGGR